MVLGAFNGDITITDVARAYAENNSKDGLTPEKVEGALRAAKVSTQELRNYRVRNGTGTLPKAA